MKLEKKTTQVDSTLGGTVRTAKIAEANLGKLWTMLQSPYKNSIGAIVREITSNCVDAQKANNVDDAIIIEFTKDESGIKIAFKDKGTGLSPKKIDDIYMNYLASDKDASDEFLGAFGIGSKSPLSYVDAFYIDTRVDGTEWNYIMSKGETSPELTELNSGDTKEPNGTTISLYLKEWKIGKKNYYSNAVGADFEKFTLEITRQLYYFTNVYVILDQSVKNYYNGIYGFQQIERDLETLNKGAIYSSELFSLRPDSNNPYREMHLTLGPVAYPIDYNQLPDSLVTTMKALPSVALKFDIGTLPVIPTREDINYGSKTTVDIIESKVKELIKFFQDKLDKIYNVEFDNIFDFIEAYDIAAGQFVNLELDSAEHINVSLDTKSIFKLKPTYSIFSKYNVTVHDFNTYYSPKYIIHSIIPFYKAVKDGRALKSNNRYQVTKDNLSNGHIYIVDSDEQYSVSKNKFICSKHGLNMYQFDLFKKPKRTLKTYQNNLNLTKANQNKWRQIIQAAQAIEQEIISYAKLYKDVQLTDAYKKEINKNKTTVDREIVVFKSLSNNYNKESLRYNAKELRAVKHQRLIIYGDKNCPYLQKLNRLKEETINSLVQNFYDFKLKKVTLWNGKVSSAYQDFSLFRTKYKNFKVNLAEVAKTKIKYIKDLPNTLSAEEFMKNRKYIRKMAKGFYVFRKVSAIEDRDNMLAFIQLVNPDLAKEMEAMISEVVSNGFLFNSITSVYENEVVKEIIEIAKENGESFKHIDAVFDKIDQYKKYYINPTGQSKESIANIIRYLRFSDVPLGKEYYLKNSIQDIRKKYHKAKKGNVNAFNLVFLSYLELEGKITKDDYIPKNTKELTY